MIKDWKFRNDDIPDEYLNFDDTFDFDGEADNDGDYLFFEEEESDEDYRDTETLGQLAHDHDPELRGLYDEKDT